MSIFVTGVAGFIGSHVAQALLERGETVVGIDNLNAYYAPQLKTDRLTKLTDHKNFTFLKTDLVDEKALSRLFQDNNFTAIIHLAAQAGVRHSIENPQAYVRSNLIGHCNILEMARQFNIGNTLYASSSSVYGGNTITPFSETHVTDAPVSFYGATKKSNELLSHSYAKLYGLSLTGLRFFTVYGPQGRPDMAYWIFSEKIKKNEPIRVFNKGKMVRDFTFIDDIVDGVLSALDRPAAQLELDIPHRIYNLGNDNPEQLMDMIDILESALEKKADKKFEDMQKGDVKQTWANIDRARSELGYDPKVSLKVGLNRFVAWYNNNWHRYL